jgi:hypothetical protein
MQRLKEIAPDSQYAEYFLNKKSFPKYYLNKPKKDETLHDYLHRLQEIIATKKKIHFIWERGLNSFLHELRKAHTRQEIAFLELIFPEEKEIRKSTAIEWVQVGKSTWEPREVPFGQIARKISPCIYPIFIITAADILRELANVVLYGRPNAKLTAAITLGLCWVCLVHARLRLPIELKNLLNIPRKNLIKPSDDIPHTLLLPTIFGNMPMPVSYTIWNYLDALSGIQEANNRTSIFQSPIKSLYRCLERTIKRLNLDPAKGKITFQTYLSQPVEFEHRYQPK